MESKSDNQSSLKSIETVRDMMLALEQEIADVKTGKTPLETARIVAIKFSG